MWEDLKKQNVNMSNVSLSTPVKEDMRSGFKHQLEWLEKNCIRIESLNKTLSAIYNSLGNDSDIKEAASDKAGPTGSVLSRLQILNGYFNENLDILDKTIDRLGTLLN